MEAIDIQLKKWGNSVGIRIPVAILRSADLKVNDYVSVSHENGAITIKAKKKKYSVVELIKGHENETEIEWGYAQGREI